MTIDRKKHYLGRHPKNAKKPHKKKNGSWNVPTEIMDAFHKLMASPDHKVPVSEDTVAYVLDAALTWTYENRAKRTADRYKDFFQDFIESYGMVRVEELTPAHVTKWLAEKKTWNATTKHNALTALQRGFNLAVRNLGLRFNPIKGMEKPKPLTRTTVITPDEFEELIDHIEEDDPFYDLMICCYDSGCRPFEIKDLEARHVQPDKQRAVIPASEAKKGIQRAIYFPTERSWEIIQKLVQEFPEGPLFRNLRGNKWTGFAVKCRFAKLEDKVGRRLHQYALRHSRITDWLLAGVDSHTVAKLAGHRSTHMLDKTYSHVADDYEYMLDKAKQQTNGASDNSNEGEEPAS